MNVYAFEGFHDDFALRNYFQWYDTVGYYGNANEPANLFAWGSTSNSLFILGRDNSTTGNSGALQLRAPASVDFSAPLPKVAWHNVPFPHTVGNTSAAVMGDPDYAYRVVIGFAIHSLASKATVNDSNSAIITNVDDNKYFEVYARPRLGDGSLVSIGETVLYTIEVGADVNDNTRLLLLFKEDGSTVATFYLPSSVAQISDNSQYIDATDTYRWRYTSGWSVGPGGIFLEFLFSENTVAVYANGTQLLTAAGTTTAALDARALTGWGFFGVHEQSTYIDDFYAINGPTRLGYNTHAVRATVQGTQLALNNDWDGSDPFGDPRVSGSTALTTATNGATALYDVFTTNQPVIGETGAQVHGLKAQFTARADDLSRPVGANGRVEPVWAADSLNPEVMPAHDVDAVPLVSYSRNYFFPPVDCLRSTDGGQCLPLSPAMILNGSFGIRYLA